MGIYAVFLLTKAFLNFGAAIIAWAYLRDIRFAGFWLFVGLADLWVGLCSLKGI